MINVYVGGKQVTVLIDTWWNVNTVSITKENGVTTVLIDTWWNVNVFKSNRNIRRYIVLIDTWWNVNFQVCPKFFCSITF